MKAEEFVLEYDLDHYGDPKGAVWEGNELLKDGDLQWVNTPMSQRNIQVGYYNNTFWRGHQYYLFYDRKCFGRFEVSYPRTPKGAIEKQAQSILKPGVRLVTPHMDILPKFQGNGIASLCYSTFLKGGNWVFTTWGHSKSAKSLWDSLARGEFISFYLGKKGKLSWDPVYNDRTLRLLGPAERFKVTPDAQPK